MRLKRRAIERTILKAIKTFPAIVLTGPRQSGKTTLFKMLFSDTHNFISLENTDVRVRAKEDPRAFMMECRPPVIIDEIQYVPELLSYIKTEIDNSRKPGNWLLTGSQNFMLMHNVAQSLAGRAAVISLLPFSFAELNNKADSALNILSWLKGLKEGKRKIGLKYVSLEDIFLRGFYPEIASNKEVDRELWCGSYITTYLERDIRNLSNLGDLAQFERFLISCATRTGQILNISEIARDIGISVPTAKRWLSLLETGYQVYLLYPYYKNIGKRIIKSPKIYFNDPALCSYLLGLNDSKALLSSPHFGNLFETVVITDFLKRFLSFGEKPSMYYLRTRDGLEVDLIIEKEGRLYLFEVKASMTITSKHIVSLKRIKDEKSLKISGSGVISYSKEDYIIKDNIMNYSWVNLNN